MRLVDCFIELFYYTAFLDSMNFAQFSYDDVREHYDELFKRSKNAAQNAGFSEDDWERGNFAVCSWIDEFVLCSDWDEKEKWARSPLQLVSYKTTNAGIEFFNRLAALGEKDKNVRGVFDYCLALGFKGRYYQASESGELENILKSNLKYITKTNELKFPDIFFPEAYTVSTQSEKRKLRSWASLLMTILSLLLPIGLFIILFLTYDDILTDIVTSYLSGF